MTPRAHRPRSPAAILLAILTCAAAALGPAATASPTLPFAADVSPACAPANASVTFTTTLRNEASDRSLGSANITAPAGFAVTAIVTPPSPGTVTFDSAVVRLRNLRVDPGGSVSVAFRATTPGAADYTWHDPAKQGAGRIQAKPTRDFSGREQFRFDLAASHVDAFVGTCALSLHFFVPPSAAASGANVTGDPLDPAGTAVAVEVLDGPGGSRVTTSTDPVSLTLVPPSGVEGAALTPAVPTVDAVDGLALFDAAQGDGFSISPEGFGYRITATSVPGITPVTSDPFDVVSGGAVCEGAGCNAEATAGGTTVRVTAPDAQPGDVITIALDVDELDCPGYIPLAGTPVVTFTVTGESIRIIRIRVPAELATRPRSQDRVCYGSDLEFVDRDGAVTNVGVLPRCTMKGPDVPPCQLRTRLAKRSGDHVISFVAPPGSTKGRT